MKKQYFTLLLMLSCFALFAQSDVSFNVTDAVTASGIENANVTLNSTTLITDVNGDVTFTNVADGTYNYTITETCYEDISGSVIVSGANVTEIVTMNSLTSAPVFVSTSSNPLIGAWVDGDIELTDGTNTYTKSVTEFDNLIPGVEFGTYTYTFTRPGACDVTGTVDVSCGTIESASGNVFLPIVSEDQTSAPVFVSTSSNPLIGAWVDGDIELTDGTNTYTKSVTEFDNLIPGVEFGTYTYTFTRPGACDVTGTVDVSCGTIESASGNVFLPIVSEDQTSAPVFVSTSSNPLIGAWVDGDIELTDGTNTYTKSVTEFDNLIPGVEFGTYTYTFTRPGACDVTGTVDVSCGTIESASGNVFLPIVSEDQTSAPVFVSTSSNPLIGAWVDGDIELTDGTNTYTKSVTEFDNLIPGVEFGTYTYTFTRPGACDVTGTVDVSCGTIESASGNVFLPIVSEDQTSAPVFVSTSSNPLIGAWVDGDIELTDGTNTYTKSVTEFDNLIPGVEFGTYTYTFTRPGACDVTGTVDVSCGTIESASGNVFLPIVSEDQTSAPVFVSTSSNPLIGAWVDGDIELTDGTNTYTKSVTEFDNLIPGVEFGTYTYTFTRPGACDVTGTVDVSCGTIESASGNVFLPIVSEDQTSAPVFVSTSSNPLIGAWVDGDIELTDGTNTYTKSVTEFDNLIPGVEFGTYTYTFTRPGACDVTGTVDVSCGTIESASGNVFLPIVSEDQTSAPVFVSTSSNPLIGAWVDGDIELTDGTNTYTKSVTEFDNLIPGVEFGTYTYTFTRPGACDVTGTVDVSCGTIESASGNVFLPIVSEDQTSAPVFVSTSSNPLIGAWVDGDIELTDGTNTYTKSVTEFDNLIPGVEFGTYTYTFTRPGACDVTGTVDVSCGTIESASGNVFLPIVSEDQTSAPVFVSTSSNPLIGAWVDGDIELTDGTNTYTKSVTEFDNLIPGVEFGTYTYTFTRPGACDVTGTVDVSCGTIESASGNVFLPIVSEDQTSAPVFVSTSSNPLIGAWVDGDIELTDGTNTYTKSVTEFDNLIPGVEFGTYTYTFTRPGACDVTGTVDVSCGTIESASGNVFLPIVSEDQTSAPVFVSTSSNPLIGAWVDGDIELTDGTNTYTKSVTEFDNLIPGVEFGTYTYTFTRPGACDVTGTVDVSCGTIESASGNVFLPIVSEDQTSAPVFVSTSSNPLIGAWVDGDIELTDGTNTYTKSVTEFDNLIPGVEFGTYTYTFTRPGACDVTGTVDVSCGTIESASGNVFLPIVSEDQTSAPVFVSTSSNPLIGAWVDGDIELTDGTNTYTKSVTEFDNLIPGVEFGTYTYTFTRPGACDVTGTVDVSCGTIESASGNVFLPIVSEDQTSAPVFVSTSSNPLIGAWVDGDIELTDGTNTYTKSVTEFDNLIPGVEFGTYTYTFTRPGACDVTGTVDVSCGTIESASGNVFLPIVSEDASVDTSVTQNNEILTANESGPGITYQWIDCDNGNAPIAGEINQTYTATTNGSYAVIISNTSCGLTETSSCFIVDTLSIESNSNITETEFYPNPVKDYLHINFTSTYNEVDIKIYSLLGQVVESVKIENSLNGKINLSDLPQGSYILRINADGNSFSKTILKN